MFKKSCTDLTKLPMQKVRQWVSSIETVICDADGVLWHFMNAIEGAAETFDLVLNTGRKALIVTNNSAISTLGFAEKAHKLGFNVEEENVLTSSSSVANFLAKKKFQKKVFVMGEGGICEELEKANIEHFEVVEKLEKPMQEFAKDLELDPEVGAVVVGRDERFNMARLIRTSAYLRDPKVLFLGTSLDAAYPIENHSRVVVGASAMVTSVKTLSGRHPLILGKPNPWMVAQLMECGVIKPESTLMVGDTLVTDMQFANNCGFQSLLVGTGVNSLKDAQKILEDGDEKKMGLVPDTYLPSFGHLREFLG
ncbi:hypothetical protein KR009_011172 [Drosophila setifemur]|nr:hypothetical protein KR009_011172 [Drosophila setifemur]